jgi:multiple sugar transport system substrate-binding protein
LQSPKRSRKHVIVRALFITAIRLTVSAALILPAAYLIAFGPKTNESVPKDRLVIDYWEKWTGREAAAMQQIVDDFNSSVGKDKGIYVRYLSTSGIDQKTLIATAGGVPPDVVGLFDPNLIQFGAAGALEPLDDLAAARGIGPNTYKEKYWEEVHYQGRLYGLVNSAVDVALYYNTDLFTAAGLSPEHPPQTLAELDSDARAMDVTDKDGRIKVAGYSPLEPGWYLPFTCSWFGGTWWDDQSRRFTLTDPRVIAAYRWIQSYYPASRRDAAAQFQSGLGNFDSPSNAFFAHTIAMEQQGTFFASFIHNQKPSMDGHWAAAPFPSAEPRLKDVTYCNCDVLCIPRGAKHVAEAFEFMAFATGQVEHEKLARAHGKISALASVSPGFWIGHPNPYIAVFDRLARSPNACRTPQCPIYAEAIDELNHVAQQVTVLGIDPAVALAAAQLTLQAKYDKFAQRQAQRAAMQ